MFTEFIDSIDQKKSMLYFTPKAIVWLMASQLDIQKGSVLDPNCGSGSILLHLSDYMRSIGDYNIKLMGYDKVLENCEYARWMVSNRGFDIEILNKDYLKCSDCNKFDAILTNPPFGFQKDIGRLESVFMNEIMNRLEVNGKASVIMPYGFLDRHKDSESRKRLFDEFNILSIILLPIEVFEAKVHTCIINIIKTTPSDSDLKIIDLRKFRDIHKEGKYLNLKSKLDSVTLDLPRMRISNANYNFSPEKYGMSLKTSNNKFVSNKFELFESEFLNKGFPLVKGDHLFVLHNGNSVSSVNDKGACPIIDANKICRFTDSSNTGQLPTIVINRVGDYCGRAFIIKEPSFITSNSMYIAAFLRDIDIYYLCYLFRYMNFNQYKSGSGNQHINQRDIYDREYLIPPIDLQKKFSEEICKTISFNIGGSNGER